MPLLPYTVSQPNIAPSATTHAQAGFTLVELSIVLIIIAFLSAGGLSIGIAQMDAQQRKLTEERMRAIEETLLNYRIANNRLPCPASGSIAPETASFGAEVGTVGDGNCTGSDFTGGGGNIRVGVVPVRSLNLPDEFMFDGWGHRITYAVDRKFTATNGFTTNNLSSSGIIIVRDATGANRTNAGVVLLLSHGKNGHGAYRRVGSTVRRNNNSSDASELENCRCTNTGTTSAATDNLIYVQKRSTATFDDIITYRTRWQLRSPMVE